MLVDVERSLLGDEALFEGGVREVADGLLAWVQPNGDWGESNATLVVGDAEALLVDTLWTPALTRRMLEALAERSRVPITTLVNTHSDGDHTWGNQLLSGAEIVATAAAARIIGEEKPAAMQRTRSMAQVLQHLPPTATLGRYLSRMLGPYDYSSIDLVVPTRQFEGSYELTIGDRLVRLEEVGPAHTPGDLIVHVPDARAVVAGDVMFVGVHPVMWAGPSANWVAALQRILDADPQAVVPGHGPPCGPEEVRALQAYMSWLQEAASTRLASGLQPKDVALELVRSTEFREAPWGAWRGPERMVITVATIDRHRRNVAQPVSGRERARLFGQVAAVAGALERSADRLS
jgi:glyoxylase-like metal-dependent hydrolase (beta-lactamase superfamily II)